MRKMGQIPDGELICVISPGQSEQVSAPWKNRNIRSSVRNITHAVTAGENAKEGMREIDHFAFLDVMVQARRPCAEALNIRQGYR